MHPHGPAAEYSLLVVRSDAGAADPLAFTEELTAFVADVSSAKPAFVIGAMRIATDPNRLVDIDLDLEEPLGTPADLLCVVRSLSGHIAFAWCRWFDLRVEVATPAMPVHQTSSSSPAKRRFLPWR